MDCARRRRRRRRRRRKGGKEEIIEGSLEAKLPTIWTDGKAQPGRSSDMETVRREKNKRWRRSAKEKVRREKMH